MKRLIISLLLIVCYTGVASADPANTIAVANELVAISADGQCSFLEAIANANNTVNGSDHLDCASGNPSGPDVISLASNSTYIFSSTANITSDITIQGFGSTLDHTGSTFFTVDACCTLTLHDMTLEGSNGAGGAIESAGSLYISDSTLQENITTSNGAAIDINASGNQTYSFVNLTLTNNVADGRGGAIYVRKVEPVSGDTTVTVQVQSVEFNSNGKWTFAGTTETNNGGGLYLTGNLLFDPLEVTVINSTFTGNYADSGGAIYVNDSVDLTVQTTTLDANDAKTQGGGLINRFGDITIEQSTISNNVANNPDGTSYGGGFNNFKGTVTISNSTISSNRADRGGGFRNYATDAITNDPAIVILDHVTLTNNTANTDGFGGAIYNRQVGTIEGRVNAQNSLILGNVTPLSNTDCRNHDGTLESFGYNVKSGSALAGCSFSGTGPGDINAESTLEPDINSTLADNGGATLTHSLPTGSAAIDAVPGGQNGCTLAQLDQRNLIRFSSGTPGCDAGAFEVGADEVPTHVAVTAVSIQTSAISGLLSLVYCHFC